MWSEIHDARVNLVSFRVSLLRFDPGALDKIQDNTVLRLAICLPIPRNKFPTNGLKSFTRVSATKYCAKFAPPSTESPVSCQRLKFWRLLLISARWVLIRGCESLLEMSQLRVYLALFTIILPFKFIRNFFKQSLHWVTVSTTFWAYVISIHWFDFFTW